VLFVVVLLGPFRAQISSLVLVGVGHFLCLFVLVVALRLRTHNRHALPLSMSLNDALLIA